MEFMELMTEWLLLREQERDAGLLRFPESQEMDRIRERKLEIEYELNKRMWGEP